MDKQLQERIRQAIESGKLEEQMSVLKMEAVKLNISEAELKDAIDAEQRAFDAKNKENEIQRRAVEAATRNKYILWGICAVLLILEWVFIFNAHPEEGESSHLVLTLVVNFITLLAVVIGAAVFFRKKN